MGAYSASKHALEGLSDSLRRELMIFNIDVVVVGMSPELNQSCTLVGSGLALNNAAKAKERIYTCL